MRQLLNLGHTLGHAIEKKSDFTISHGYAVAIGMHLAAKAAEAKGLAEAGLAEEIRIALERNGLPFSVSYSAEEMMEGVLRDKKRRGGEISFVFPIRIGHCEMRKIPMGDLAELIEKALK